MKYQAIVTLYSSIIQQKELIGIDRLQKMKYTTIQNWKSMPHGVDDLNNFNLIM